MVTTKPIKVLEICNFSSGISGVWTRVLEDSREFIKKGYKVFVFSSNQQENNETELPSQEVKEGIDITRFPVKRKIGYALWFDFEEEAIKLNPDIIICHGLRKPYLNQAIKISKKINAKIFLITHAPFIDKELRSTKLNFMIKFYDKFYGKKIMNSFDKILAICKWEIKVLIGLSCDVERIIYLPNSLSDEFFNQKKVEEKKKILFLGRMHPVKELEILIEAFKKSDLKGYELEIVSSKEGSYYKELNKLKQDNIIFTEPIDNLKQKIEKIDSAEIFVLPSRKESLPFGIIEAMSRGKIIIATKTEGGKELIDNDKNGFLFDIGDSIQLQSILNKIKKMSEKEKNKIRDEATKTSKQFKVSNIMDKWERLFKNEIKR